MGRLRNPFYDKTDAMINKNCSIIKTNNVHDVYAHSIYAIIEKGELQTRKNENVTCLKNVMFEITPTFTKEQHTGFVNKHIFCNKANISPDKQRANFAWCMTFTNNMDLAVSADENYLMKSTDGQTVESGYGKYWKYQVPGLIKKLMFDKNSPDANIIMNNESNTNDSVSVEVDRGLSVNFKIHNTGDSFDVLDMTVYMSRSEIYDELPYDLYNFASLHALVLNELGFHYPTLMLGTYTHVVNDLYLRDHNEHMLEFDLMNEDEINQLSEGITFDNHVNFTNFWFYQPDCIFKNLKKDLYTAHVRNYNSIISYAITNIFAEEYWLTPDRSEISNDFTIEEIMPVINQIKEKAIELNIPLPYINDRDDVENFEYLYDCQRAVGRTILVTTFITCAILNGNIDNFKHNHEMILTHSSLKYPVTKYCAYMALI